MKKKTVFMATCLFASAAAFAQTSSDSISYDVKLSEVVVKSSLPKEKAITGGKSTRVVGTTLAKVGTAKQVIGHLSGVYLKKDHSHNLTEVFAKQEYYDRWNTSESVDSHQQQTHTLNAFLNSTLGKWTFSLNGCFLSSTSKPQSAISEQSERYQDMSCSRHPYTISRRATSTP